MTYELIISEKPSAAKKIAESLADKNIEKKSESTVPYYVITHNKKKIVVACAVGHLYTVTEKTEKGKTKKWTYPVFDVEWKPTNLVDKNAAYSSKYLAVIKKLSKDADEFVIACDYDIEGETIGYNILRFACSQKDGRRMKFSTLTKDELIESYEHASKHIDWGQANAGTTRHVLDYYYGINLSRALSLSVQAAGSFKILSSGRVQGPALKIIVDREKEIKAFKPEPYWQLELHGKPKSPREAKDRDKEIIALHKEDKFWEEAKAKKIHDKIKGKKEGRIDSVEKNQFKQEPPHPFDLTTLQTESYRSMRIQPKDALAIAQELYLKGLISYPRTSSQQLPPAIGYGKIFSSLLKNKDYARLVEELLAQEKKGKKLAPNNGKKTDPAHPAIFPTGQHSEISGREAKIYDIIVRRFLATFGETAVRETATINIDVEREIFIAKGTRTVEKGWHIFYGPHLKLEEEELPHVEKNDIISIKKIDLLSKETQPPKRYTPASIIKELEKRGLGTKATRASIVDSLFQRGYAQGTAIEATDLGIKTCETLEKYCPSILDEELTRHFEEEMESIREKNTNGESVLQKAKEILTKILEKFKKHEKEIGKELLQANRETIDSQNFMGQCPKCKEGKLMVRRGKFGRFSACDKYPECKTTASLPAKGMLKSTEEKCEKCFWPIIEIKMARRGPQKVCINQNCPGKAISKKEEKIEKPCPKCKEAGKEGTLIVRKSIYGSFLGCTNYPNCRHNERLENDNSKPAKSKTSKDTREKKK